MRPIPVGDGGTKILPLASESLGVRSMATFIETDDIKLVVDPGSALGPRFNLNPHEREYLALAESRRRILEAAREADVLTISHYHFDHYLPSFEDWLWIWSSPKLAERLYEKKLILAKDTNSNINLNQRKRGYVLEKFSSRIAKEIRAADNNSFEFGDTILEFSKPIFHGQTDSALGYVLILTIRTPGYRVVHASDVQGPMYAEPLKLILGQRPDLLIIGGPPIYLKGSKVNQSSLAEAQQNLMILAKQIPRLIVDHHLLRSLDYGDYIRPVLREAEKAGNLLQTFAEFSKRESNLLEARRKELYELEPIEHGWHKRLKRREFRQRFYRSHTF